MGIAYNPKIVTDGLVLLLDAANSKSYPGTGNTWYDVSSKGNHCVFSNLPTYANGAFTLNGTTNQGTITNNATLNFSSEQTVTMILKHTFTVGRRNPWDQAYGGYGTWTHEAGNGFNYFYGDAGVNGSPYTALGSGGGSTPTGVWGVFTIVRNTTDVRWYRNGSLLTVQANPYADLTATTPDIRIGNGYAGFWEGQMAAVYAYTKALTAQEVKQNFNATRGRYGI